MELFGVIRNKKFTTDASDQMRQFFVRFAQEMGKLPPRIVAFGNDFEGIFSGF